MKEKLGFTIANKLTSLVKGRSADGYGFTMAEILLSLTIIGVVAAITLPSLTGNINERTWNTQRKALYARLSQAIALMPSLNGYGTYDGKYTGSAANGSVSATTDTAAETFVTEGLSKVLKINNICDATHLSDCGLNSTYINLVGSTKSMPTRLGELGSDCHYYWHSNRDKAIDTKAAAFETANGESIAIFYNPNCEPDLEETAAYHAQLKVCANFIYDLNGTKGPNTVGKDIGFITALYATDPVVVAPQFLTSDASSSTVKQTEASALCKAQDPESRLPNIDELSATSYNRDLIGITNNYWSGSVISSGESGQAWYQQWEGTRAPSTRSNKYYVRCVKR